MDDEAAEDREEVAEVEGTKGEEEKEAEEEKPDDEDEGETGLWEGFLNVLSELKLAISSSEAPRGAKRTEGNPITPPAESICKKASNCGIACMAATST